MRRSRLLPTLVAALAAALLAPAAPVRAETAATCDAPLVDAAERIPAGDAADVRRAVEELAATGATVRVRTIARLPDGVSIDGWIAGQVQACASWRDAAGTRAPTLVVVAVSFAPRQASITWGEDEGQIGRAADTVRTGVLVPALRSGDVAGGLAATLDALRGTVATPAGIASPASSDEATGTSTVPGIAPGVVVTVTTPDGESPFTFATGPTDVTGGGDGATVDHAFGIGMAIVVVIGVIGVALRLAGVGGSGGGSGGGSSSPWSSWSSGSGSDSGSSSWSSGSDSGGSGWSGGGDSGGSSGGSDGGSSSGGW